MGKSKKDTILKKLQNDADFCLRREIHLVLVQYSKLNDVLAALKLFQKHPTVILILASYNLLLYMFSLYQSDTDSDQLFIAATTIWQRIQNHYKPDISAYSSYIRLLCLNGQVDQAYQLLRTMIDQEKMEPKLRVYGMIIYAYCSQMQLDSAQMVFDEMIQNEIEPSATEYLNIMSVLAQNSNKFRFMQMLQQLTTQFTQLPTNDIEYLIQLIQQLYPQTQISQLNPLNLALTPVNPLSSLWLEEGEHWDLIQQLEHKIPTSNMTHLRHFKQWLQKRTVRDRPIYVLDGANIGYFKQSGFSKPKIQFSQINELLQTILRTDPKALIIIILHSRHLITKDPYELALISRWNLQGFLWTTPPGMNDDLFWLLASLFLSSVNRSTYVITNDEMRDHYYNLKFDRLFARWKELFVVNFEYAIGQNFTLLFPPAYSYACQHNITTWFFPHNDDSHELWSVVNIQY